MSRENPGKSRGPDPGESAGVDAGCGYRNSGAACLLCTRKGGAVLHSMFRTVPRAESAWRSASAKRGIPVSKQSSCERGSRDPNDRLPAQATTPSRDPTVGDARRPPRSCCRWNLEPPQFGHCPRPHQGREGRSVPSPRRNRRASLPAQAARCFDTEDASESLPPGSPVASLTTIPTNATMTAASSKPVRT